MSVKLIMVDVAVQKAFQENLDVSHSAITQ